VRRTIQDAGEDVKSTENLKDVRFIINIKKE